MSDDTYKRVDYEINTHGDKPLKIAGSHGTDISSSRLAPIDRAAIAFVLEHGDTPVVGVDVGCGFGIPSIAMALSGARMTLIDVADLSERFDEVKRLLPTDNIRFLQRDALSLSDKDFDAPIDFLYSQRTIHYMPYPDALTFLKTMFSLMRSGGKVFMSAAGMKTEHSQGYEGVDVPIEKRFFTLAPEIAAKHEIYAPICLYNPEEFRDLLVAAGFTVVELITTGKFGNVKGIFIKP